MEGSKVLAEKYANLAGSKPVERAVSQSIRETGKGPSNNEERVDAYLYRAESLANTRDDKGELRGYKLLKEKVLDRYTLKVTDPATVEKIATAIYESEKRIAIERGQGGEVEQLEQHDVTERYKALVLEKAEIQKKTLSSWLDYLQQNDAQHPAWFRYLAIRNLERMGTLDTEKVTYTKRAASTVASFPELNSEALGWVYKRLDTRTIPERFSEEKRATLQKLLDTKDFPGLYAFAQVETEGALDRSSLEGEWKKYEQGSDYTLLEGSLEGKGTRWCTAEGSAKNQLEAGDFYVYYTKNKDGVATEPRIAIRMEGDSVAEVRGVGARQELEPELIEIAQEKYRHLPDGASYDKKAHDMKEVTRLFLKQKKGVQFTKDELVFIYEIDSEIEGFGYQHDGRITDIICERKLAEDLATIADCDIAQVAFDENQAATGTKFYSGAPFPKMFTVLPSDIEYLFTAPVYCFPRMEHRIRFREMNLGTDGRTGEELVKMLVSSGTIMSWREKALLSDANFVISNTPERIELVELSVESLGFNYTVSYDTICRRALELGLELCPAEVGPRLRLQYVDQPREELLVIGMETTYDVFLLHCDGGAHELRIWDMDPFDSVWKRNNRFVFRRPRN